MPKALITKDGNVIVKGDTVIDDAGSSSCHRSISSWVLDPLAHSLILANERFTHTISSWVKGTRVIGSSYRVSRSRIKGAG